MSNQTKNTMVPKLRFPEFEDSGEWEEAPLESFCSNIASGKNGINIGGQYRLYGSTGIIGKTNDYSYEGDYILVARVGANAGLLTRSSGKFGVTDNALVISLKAGENIDFINYTLERFGLTKLVFGSGQPLITGGQLKALTIYFPKPGEQKKIADSLSFLGELITAQSEKVEALKAHKQGLMQRLFPAEGETMPKLRFAKFRDSREWEEDALDNVAIFLKGKGISKSDISKAGNLPCIRYGELYTYYAEIINSAISFTNLSSDELILSEANDVIMPSSGETAEDIATASCVIKSGIALGGDLNIIRSEINGVFLSYYLSHAKKSSIAKLAQGDAVVHLYSSQLKKLIINFPESKTEQQKIADCLSSLDELITAQTKKIEVLKTHKKGLMQGLFPTSETALANETLTGN